MGRYRIKNGNGDAWACAAPAVFFFFASLALLSLAEAAFLTAAGAALTSAGEDVPLSEEEAAPPSEDELLSAGEDALLSDDDDALLFDAEEVSLSDEEAVPKAGPANVFDGGAGASLKASVWLSDVLKLPIPSDPTSPKKSPQRPQP